MRRNIRDIESSQDEKDDASEYDELSSHDSETNIRTLRSSRRRVIRHGEDSEESSQNEVQTRGRARVSRQRRMLESSDEENDSEFEVSSQPVRQTTRQAREERGESENAEIQWRMANSQFIQRNWLIRTKRTVQYVPQVLKFSLLFFFFPILFLCTIYITIPSENPMLISVLQCFIISCFNDASLPFATC